MRIKQKLEVIGIFLLVELFILMLIGVVFYFQFDKERDEFVSKTRAIAETIGEQANSYFLDYGKEPSTDEFYMFLDERLGRKKLFNTFDISPKFFSVIFKKDLKKSGENGYFMKGFLHEGGYIVKKEKGLISVSVPFSVSASKNVFGIVKIDSDTGTLLKKVFSDNFLLYAAMLVVLNNQALILFLFMRRKKEAVVFDKGYLKEHSIGALKIMHRVLGDIIEDHSTAESKKVKRIEDDKTNEAMKNVISISKLFDKEK